MPFNAQHIILPSFCLCLIATCSFTFPLPAAPFFSPFIQHIAIGKNRAAPSHHLAMLFISSLILSPLTPFASATLGGTTDPSSQTLAPPEGDQSTSPPNPNLRLLQETLITPEGDQSTTTSPPPNPNVRLLQSYQWKNWENTVECHAAFLVYPSKCCGSLCTG